MRRLESAAAAATPNSTIIGGAGTGVPLLELCQPLDPPELDEELLDEELLDELDDELVLDEDEVDVLLLMLPEVDVLVDTLPDVEEETFPEVELLE